MDAHQNPNPPKPRIPRVWIFVWVGSISVMPLLGLTLTHPSIPSSRLVALITIGTGFIGHLTSSIIIGRTFERDSGARQGPSKSGCTTAGLLFGGWAVFVGMLLLGCAMNALSGPW